MSYSYITVELRQRVYERAKGCCEYCQIPETAVLFTHQIDHIIAEKHGGLTEFTNLALACVLCNKYKGSDIASIDHETDEIVRLFNPRLDRWDAHFLLSSGKIEPLSAIGRVTVNVLQHNRAERVAERKLLMQTGLLTQGKD